MSENQMFGVFGPGDGKPVAVYSDADEAAREGRRRFGDNAFVYPVSLTASELKAAVEARPELAAAVDGPARANRLEVLRSQARAELHDEVIKEALKDEMRDDVRREVRDFLGGNAKAVKAEDKAAAELLETRVESARESHEAVTGEALPEGQLPPSSIHSAGPAPFAAGKGDQQLAQPIAAVSEPGAIVTDAPASDTSTPSEARSEAKAAADEAKAQAKADREAEADRKKAEKAAKSS